MQQAVGCATRRFRPSQSIVNANRLPAPSSRLTALRIEGQEEPACLHQEGIDGHSQSGNTDQLKHFEANQQPEGNHESAPVQDMLGWRSSGQVQCLLPNAAVAVGAAGLRLKLGRCSTLC